MSARLARKTRWHGISTPIRLAPHARPTGRWQCAGGRAGAEIAIAHGRATGMRISARHGLDLERLPFANLAAAAHGPGACDAARRGHAGAEAPGRADLSGQSALALATPLVPPPPIVTGAALRLAGRPAVLAPMLRSTPHEPRTAAPCGLVFAGDRVGHDDPCRPPAGRGRWRDRTSTVSISTVDLHGLALLPVTVALLSTTLPMPARVMRVPGAGLAAIGTPATTRSTKVEPVASAEILVAARPGVGHGLDGRGGDQAVQQVEAR